MFSLRRGHNGSLPSDAGQTRALPVMFPKDAGYTPIGALAGARIAGRTELSTDTSCAGLLYPF